MISIEREILKLCNYVHKGGQTLLQASLNIETNCAKVSRVPTLCTVWVVFAPTLNDRGLYTNRTYTYTVNFPFQQLRSSALWAGCRLSTQPLEVQSQRNQIRRKQFMFAYIYRRDAMFFAASPAPKSFKIKTENKIKVPWHLVVSFNDRKDAYKNNFSIRSSVFLD